ncbi:MAG: DNA2/NAM7 family helicase, partial [Clostridia bacterium]|nr:DNA2/NAM7 family helicase [Clostridia bacterium]
LLLDCESEATAAKINPSQVRKDLKELLLARETYKQNYEVYAKLNQASATATSAQKVLNEYENIMFSEQMVGGISYFDALDITAKYDLPVIEFVPDKTAQICPKELYLHTLDKVIECGKYFDEMTNNRSYSVKNNIFYGINPSHDISAVISRLAPIGKIAEKLVALVNSLAQDQGVSTEKLSLDTLYALTSSALGDDERAKLIAYKDIEDIASRLSTALENYDKLPEVDESIVELNDELPALAQAIKSLKADDSLTVAQYRSIVKNSAVITEIKWTDELFNSLIKIVNDTDAQIKLSEEKLYNARAVIKKELNEKEEKLMLDGYDALNKYLSDNVDKPKLFDLKAKSALKKIEPLKIMQVGFAETVKAVANYKEYKDAQSKIERNAYEVNRIFRAVLDNEQIALISQVVTRCRILGELPSDYVMRVLGEVKTIDKAVKLAPETATLAEIKQAVIKVNAKAQVLNALAYASKNADIFTSCELLTVDKARAINAFCFVIALSSGDTTAVEKYYSFAQKIAQNRNEICSLISEFNSLNIEFSKEFYPTEFTKRDITLPAVLQYSLDYDKINKATDALNFASVMQGEIFPIDRFFDLLNQDSQGKELSYGERFEHTFYSLASRAKKNEIGKALGNEIDINREKYRDGVKRLEQSNIELIENMLMTRIDLADPDYAFLQKENDQSALRLMFSTHARAILKLKPCMILSPSSVSVLMRPQDYENFDCVIVDEASQLEPVSALPSLFRARSCVIVGDEWQMPPISHFKLRVETPDEELEPSLLALALESKAFRAEELKCHYRSETESLIRFSQARYYDGMKTFPAQTPKTETLGFNDIYISDGCCEHGVNLAEAKAVVDIIADNFEKYYKDGKLTRTLGIVAFGESQIDKIKSLAKSDARLKKFRHNPDDESAGCFYRTIEKVQGQEATDMILSLTYGKRADGSVNQSFAELNRGKLGECIFNVAVTRAKQSVT